MMKKLFHKVVIGFSYFAILLQVFSPFAVIVPQSYAQESTVALTNAPTDNVIPSPIVTLAPAVSSTDAPAPTIVPTTNDEHIMASVVQNVAAPTIDLSSVDVASATLTTDKADYAPTDTAIISGTGFIPNKVYTLEITSSDPPAVNFSTQVTADNEGNIVYAYQLDGTYRPNYQVAVKDADGNVVATTTFTDGPPPPSSVNIEQCANGQLAGPFNICKKLSGSDGYVTGNVNASKAHWKEGEFLPYRALIETPFAGAQQVQFSFDTAKSSESKHAIDYLSSFNLTETTGSANSEHANQHDPCSDFISGCNPSSPDLTATIPVPNSLTSTYPATCANGTFGGTPTSGVISAWVSTGNISNLAVAIDAPSTSGDCPSIMTVTFDLSNPSAKVVLAWSGHVSANNNPGSGGFWGPGTAIPTGSPYHLHAGFPQLSDSQSFNVGNQDLQLASSAIIQPGHIIVIKDAVPNSAQDFTFTNNFGNGNPTTFDLDDDADETLSNSRNSAVIAGKYSVAEGAVAGWTSNGGICDQGETPDDIDVAGGETVTCTFTNTRDTGKIQLVKDFIGTPEDVTIKIGTSEGGSQVESKALSADGSTLEHTEVTGTYYVSEVLATPSNYNSTLTCFNDVNDDDVIDGGDISHAVNTSTGAVALGKNEDVICKYTNTRHTGTIELKKIWSGTAGQTTLNIGTSNGGAQIDTQLTGVTGGAPLTTGQNPVDTGTYYLSETGGLTNYTSSALVCYNDANDNGSNDGESAVSVGSNDSVSVGDGQHVICSYTNTRNTGTVIVKKVMVGGTDTFNYTGTPNGSISVNEGILSQVVDTGAYQSVEGAKEGWDLTSVVCDDNNSTGDKDTRTASFNVETGETVTCTFTNTKRAHIIIVKNAVPNNAQDFSFTGSDGIGLFLLDDDGNIANTLPKQRDFEVIPGTYSVSETMPTGWQEESVVCDNEETANNIDVAAGETVTCTFTNEKLAKIILIKNTIGGNGDFDFDATGSGLPTDIDLTTISGTESETFENLNPDNTYSIAENVPSGWDLTSSSCTGTNTPESITPNAGETITCTFTNTKRGDIKLVKNTVGGNAEFSFAHSIVGLASSLTTVAGTADDTSDKLVPGSSYAITEDGETGWDLTGASCKLADGTTSTGTVVAGAITDITVESGKSTTCTFTNTKRGSLEITKVLDLNGYLFSSTLDASFDVVVTGPSYPAPTGTTLTFTVVDGLLTNSPQSLTNLLPGVYTVTESDPGISWTVTGNGNVTIDPGEAETKTITNDLKIPSTRITMTPDVFETTLGGNVTLTITDTNNGDVPISNPSVELYANSVLTFPQPTYVSGDTNTNTKMDIGETWTWTWTGTISVNTEFTVNGIGTDPLGNPVNGPTYASETTSQTVRVIGTTRTIGFWQTHTTFTTHVFNTVMGATMPIGTSVPVCLPPTDCSNTHKGTLRLTSQIFGGFYAPIAKTSSGAKRNPVDQSRIQMLQQLLAAKLNCAAFGCSGTTLTLIANADAAYLAGANKNTSISLAGQLDSFNNSGDAGAIPPALGATGKATPKDSQILANIAFWDQP